MRRSVDGALLKKLSKLMWDFLLIGITLKFMCFATKHQKKPRIDSVFLVRCIRE